ncbi:TM2 domain-containing protein almondex isoform X2 [Anthonomus grandis grandis]|uniref:TM2 domain-containing protein almondex isoform X2 n=1 Tax=Anthonomus grandis grandis TaxID=2921223 RepID=UPI0021664A12|nr:TM2 domain-containing protein almondex isoform X2 [Anthonomus grandis grandis]
MRCVHINIRQATFILLTFLANNIQTADNTINTFVDEKKSINIQDENKPVNLQSDTVFKCPLNIECKELPAQCLDCELSDSCIYGKERISKCRNKAQVKCHGSKEFDKKYICRYCYQTEPWEHSCEQKATCQSVSSPRDVYVTNCTVNGDILCLGEVAERSTRKSSVTGLADINGPRL